MNVSYTNFCCPDTVMRSLTYLFSPLIWSWAGNSVVLGNRINQEDVINLLLGMSYSSRSEVRTNDSEGHSIFTNGATVGPSSSDVEEASMLWYI